MREWIMLRNLILILLASAVSAQAASYNLSSNCTLQRYNGKAWDPVPASALPGRVRDPLTRKGGKTLFRIGGSWYMTEESCLTRNRIDPLAREDDRESHRWVFDLSGGFAMLSGQRFQDQVDTTGGYSITTPGASSAIPLGIGVGYRLSDSLTLRYSVTRMKTTQTGQYSGSVSGKAVYEHDFYHFGFGVLRYFNTSETLRPYAGVDAGYAFDSGLFTLTGFEGIFSGLNGGVDVNSSGLFFGVRGGADWQLDRKWSLFGELAYQLTLYGNGKVNASTTSFYTAGGTVPYSSASRIMLLVGGRFWL
jgi:hypothetical protein